MLRRLAAAGHVIAKLCLATRKAAAALSGQFAHSFFMPLCLTGLAILARIQARRPPLCACYDRVTPVARLFRACYSQFSAHPLAGSVRTFLIAPTIKKTPKASDACRCRRWRHSWRWTRRAPTMRSLLWCRRYLLTATPLPSWVRTGHSLSSWHACTFQSSSHVDSVCAAVRRSPCCKRDVHRHGLSYEACLRAARSAASVELIIAGQSLPCAINPAS